MTGTGNTCTHVAAFIVVGDGILLQRRSRSRSFMPGAWDVIGGSIEAGESPCVALRREVAEETGLIVRDVGPWLTDVTFNMGNEECREIGALVFVEDEVPRLEAGKAECFAVAVEVEPFATENQRLGYEPHLERTVGAALRALEELREGEPVESGNDA